MSKKRPPRVLPILMKYKDGLGLTDIFRECRERVSTQDAAHHYGLTFDRKGWAVCPFHQDRHPSMSFRAGRFRCWACGASGDCIDFTGRLLGLEPMAAVERLNADFVLALPINRRLTSAEAQAAHRRIEIAKAHKQFEEWRETFISRLCAAYCVAHIALQGIDTPEDIARLSGREVLAIRWQSCFEYWADTLSDGTPEDQAQIYREREGIGKWIDRVLSI